MERDSSSLSAPTSAVGMMLTSLHMAAKGQKSAAPSGVARGLRQCNDLFRDSRIVTHVVKCFLGRGALSIEVGFDVSFIAGMALREKQVQQNYRPIIAVHKWFARRPGTLFR